VFHKLLYPCKLNQAATRGEGQTGWLKPTAKFPGIILDFWKRWCWSMFYLKTPLNNLLTPRIASWAPYFCMFQFIRNRRVVYNVIYIACGQTVFI